MPFLAWFAIGGLFLMSACIIGLAHFEEQKEEREPLALAGSVVCLACAFGCLFMAGAAAAVF